MPTHLTAIFKSFTVPKKGDALQGGKVEKPDKIKKRGGRGQGSLAHRRAGTQA